MTRADIPIGLHGRVISCLNRVISQDFDLLNLNAHEQALSSKLANYLQQEFSSHNVDCEYNRYGRHLKFTGSDWEERESRPDIVVHERGNGRRNLLVVEIKKFDSPVTEYEKTIKKLCEFTQTHLDDYHYYGYKYGLLLSFDNTAKVTIEWYSNGLLVAEPKSYFVKEDKCRIKYYSLIEN